MEAKKIDVLLICKGKNGYSTLSNRLARQGCQCRLASSAQKVGALLDKHSFDLVLTPLRLNGNSMYPLISRLDGFSSTLFFSLVVEDGSWWLPALWQGLNCFGAPALRPSEFVTVLDKTVEGIRSRMRVAAETHSPIASRLSASVMNLLYSHREPPIEFPATPKIRSLMLREALG